MVFFSCDNLEEHSPSETKYSFFVAGHAYGNPNQFQYGLYPKFKNLIDTLNTYDSIQLGIFAGDIVPRSQQAYWDSLLIDLELFDFPTHIAAGNHDRGELFESIFKDYYYQFTHKNDLFIILSPTDWNIEGEQKEFLFNAIREHQSSVTNIFIFCHELIWWSPENQFKNIEINYRPHYPGSSNYWEEIHPILDSLDKDVYIFAGDLGATDRVDAYMYFDTSNVHLMATGMGGGKDDNMLIVEVKEDNEVRIKLMGFDYHGMSEMGDIRDYVLP